MKPKYCQYCGQPLTENCGCERIVAEETEQLLKDYENDPEHQYGWYQQDMIDLRRREQ